MKNSTSVPTDLDVDDELPSRTKLLGIASRIASYKRALKPDDVADLLGVTRETVLRWAREGRIPHFKVAALVRFDPRILSQWVKNKRGKS